MTTVLFHTILPWVIIAQLSVVGWYTVRTIPNLWNAVRTSTRSALFLFGVLFLISIGIRVFVVPATHRIYFDEDRYLGPAVAFTRYGQAANILLATPTELLMSETDTAIRLTVPILHALVLRLAGYQEELLFMASTISSIFQILLLAVFATRLLGSTTRGLIAASIFAFLPVSVFWSASIGLDSYFVGFFLLACVATQEHQRHRNWRSLLFFQASLILLVFVRLEALLCLPILIVVLWHRARSVRAFLKRERQTLFMLTLILVLRGLLSISVLGKTWCCGDATPLEAFQIGYFFRHLIPNTLSFVTRPEIPIAVSLLAVIGLRQRGHYRRVLLSWFVLFFLLYSTYFAGLFFSVEYSGSYGRYALILMPVLAILASLGVCQVDDWLRPYLHTPSHRYVLILGISILVLSPTWKNYPKLVTTSPYYPYVDRGPEQVHRYLEEVILPNTESNAVVIHSLTSITALYGRSSVYFASALYHTQAQAFIKEALKQQTPVYMIQTYACETFPKKCEELFAFAQIETVKVQDTTGNQFEFVRLLPRSQ